MSDAGVRVRRAEAADLERLEQLEALFPGDRLSRASLRRLLGRPSAEVWVAELDGAPVGDAVCLFRRGFHGARLYSLVVAPEARGRGVGAALLGAVEAGARARGAVALRLEVREDNAVARALYERAGFETVGRTADYYADHSAALRMRKRLDDVFPQLFPVPFYPQSLEFTCGPACLMMALRYLGRAAPFERGLELDLWREATTVFMLAGHGGCSPHGLALAALRRGLRATVVARDAAVPFEDSVRKADKKAVIRLVHERFREEFLARGGREEFGDFGPARAEAALEAGGVPILMVSGYRLYAEKIPHWVVVAGFDDGMLYLHDPFLPRPAGRADAVHLPLAKGDFERVSTFGKARHRYLVVLERPPGEAPALADGGGGVGQSPAR